MKNTKLVLSQIVIVACLGLLSGCAMAPLKGGRATTTGVIEQTVVQSENPAQVSRQEQETLKTRSYTMPAGSRLVSTSNQVIVVSAPMSVVEHEETRAKTELGAAQKDTARELGAKLASLKGVVWVGLLMFIFGLASIFYPPLQAIIGSVTTSAAILAGGVALMILPSLVVGNELWILAGVATAVGLWFLAHRHGQLRGLVDAAKNAIEGQPPVNPPDKV
ncbi:MAG: hypothetical protein ACREDQ_05325 [Limisphaerales bacterium]